MRLVCLLVFFHCFSCFEGKHIFIICYTLHLHVSELIKLQLHNADVFIGMALFSFHFRNISVENHSDFLS